MRVNLPVPFVTQQGAPLEYNPNDCSQASVAQIINAYTGSNLSALDVALATGTNDNKPQSMASAVRQGAVYGIELNIRTSPNAIPAWYRAMLNDGKPVIALCDYFYLPKPGDFPHFLIVKGYDTDSGSFILNDPYQTNGADWEVTEAQFNAAISSARYNYPYQAIYPTEALPMTTNIGGMNLDARRPAGKPSAATLDGIPYARLLYNVSNNTGSTDLNAAYNLYAPYLNELKSKNITPVVILNHQTYGEGRGYNWEQMNPTLWEQFTSEWLAFIVNIIHAYVGKGVVYQIWNEQDTLPENARAAVPIPAAQYGNMFRRVYSTIKGIDTAAKVITGGHVNGAAAAGQYLRDAGITQADGVGCHPYGQGASNNPNYRPFGTIEGYLNTWKQYTNLPLWITEFGVLDQPSEPLAKVIDYARDFVAAVHGKVVSAIWYAFADTMDNGYGAANSAGVVKVDSTGRTLLDPFKGGTTVPNTGDMYLDINTTLNVRSDHSLSAPVLGVVRNGDLFIPSTEVAKEGGYTWRRGKTKYSDNSWLAVSGGSWTVKVKC